MEKSSSFHGAIDGNIVIPAPHSSSGGTINFNFGDSHSRSKKHDPFSTIPFAPDSNFVDRPDILEWMFGKFSGLGGARAGLVGLGGVGKSQLAIHYCYSVRKRSPQTFVFWVHAGSKARFQEAYRDIADRLELPERNDPKNNVLQMVKNWLGNEMNGNWIMVIDNADDLETFFTPQNPTHEGSVEHSSTLLANYLSQSPNGSILITSRNKDVAAKLAGGYQNLREVQAMDEPQAVQLLQNKLRDSPTENTAELVNTLGCIPLAITQAAAYINRRTRMTVSRYLEEFHTHDTKRKENLLNWDAGDLRRDLSVSNSVTTTWQLSFNHLREERKSAADLLSIMSFFNPQGIPDFVLRKYNQSVSETTSPDEADISYEEDLDTLQAYSLISVTAADQCEMHALVQFCTQVWLSTFSDLAIWKQRFLTLMAQEFPEGKFENWAECEKLLPHVESLYATESTIEPHPGEFNDDWARILTNAASYMRSRGDYKLAQSTATKAHSAREKMLGQNDRRTLLSGSILATILEERGIYKEAENLSHQVLTGRISILGEEHAETLESQDTLALVMLIRGRFGEAERLHKQTLQGREKTLGKHHPDTLGSLNNLAVVLQAQGKYREAEGLYRIALEGRQRQLGEQHPDTLTSATNVASALIVQGHFKEGENLLRQTLENSKILGKQHPDTLLNWCNLGVVLHNQGRYDEATKMFQKALAGSEELGLEHPLTLRMLSSLGVTFLSQGKYADADKIIKQAMRAYEELLGEFHPETLRTVSSLAEIYQAQGQYNEAEALFQRALHGRRQELGEEHLDTLESLSDVASILWIQENFEEAERLNRKVLEGREKILGRDHAITLTSVNNLATVLQGQGDYIEAERLYRETLERREKLLGQEHPYVALSKCNLATVLQAQEKLSEAEDFARQALELREKTLGGKHYDTLNSVAILASILDDQGKCEEGERLYQRGYDEFKEKGDFQHPRLQAWFNQRSTSEAKVKEDTSRHSETAMSDNTPADDVSTCDSPRLNGSQDANKLESHRKSKRDSLYRRLKGKLHR